MFALEVEYLLGRSFAGDFRDRGEPEWPPHPSRLFSALAAAYFESGNDSNERAALEWLESQPPPLIRAGAAGQPAPVTAFVPTNYPGDAVPVLRGKQPRTFAAQAPSEFTVHFIWPDCEPDPAVAKALDALASRAGYLGKACSLVRMRVRPDAPDANWAPDPSGEYSLRVTGHGRLCELERLFAADLRPSPGPQHRYVNLEERQAREDAVRSEFGHMDVFRRIAGPGLPIEATVTLTDAVRAALMSIAGQAGPVAGILHGHTDRTHCAVVALPFIGSQHADGRLMGFAIVTPRAASPAERRAVLAAGSSLSLLRIPGFADWALEPQDAPALQASLRPATWTRASKVWQTVTPILLDRFPKKKGPSVEEIVAGACRRIGLPGPVRIEHGPYSALEGVPPVPAFRLHRSSDARPRWAVHATIEFNVPVQGPVLLGAGRYFGLGLLRPADSFSKGNADDGR